MTTTPACTPRRRRQIVWTLLTAGMAMLWSLGSAPMALPVWSNAEPHGLVLLIPQRNALEHPVTQAWLDAARQEGVAVTPMTADRFLQAVAWQETLAGVLVPDTVHRQASDAWVQALETYVHRGGHALLSFDAALFKPHQQGYAAAHARLSRLTGFQYALDDPLQHTSTAFSPVLVHRETQKRLGLQRGDIDFRAAAARSLAPAGEWGVYTTSGRGSFSPPHFRTRGVQDARIWMRSPEGDPVLSSRAHGQGRVVFANLPLGELKLRTDGQLLHRLLSDFAQNVLQQPLLQREGGQQVHWQTHRLPGSDLASLHAHSPGTLAGTTWVFAKGAVRGMHLLEGQAQIIEDANHWRVVAGDVQQITLHWQQPQE